MLTAKMTKAFDFAREVHAYQTRKGTSTPYISHPLAVCSLVLEHEGDEDEACAALLHDVVEDGGGLELAARMKESVGSRVTDIVLECSDSALPRGMIKAPWKERKIHHLHRMKDASDSAKLVMAADKLHNARSIAIDLRRGDTAEVWSRFQTGRDGYIWYLGEASVALSSVGTRGEPLVKELRRVVKELDNA